MLDLEIAALISFPLIASPLAEMDEPISSPSITEKIPPRTSFRKMGFQLANPPQLQTMGTYVGQLQERWQFFSDHLQDKAEITQKSGI